ncbi:predicted protein [Postia placenta Mad-698-R]|nr:predicted protein [Postia placenta Mad-698-R]
MPASYCDVARTSAHDTETPDMNITGVGVYGKLAATVVQMMSLLLPDCLTDEFLRRFDKTLHPFSTNSINSYDWGDDVLGQQVFAPNALKDEVAHLLLTKPHASVHRYIELAIVHCAEGHIFLLFNILLHREDIPLDNIDACMQQHPPLAYSVLKHCLPTGPARLPDAMAPLATFIIRNVICSATHFGITALAAVDWLANDLTRINLAAYLNLLWSVTLGVRAADLVQELLLVLHEQRSAGESADADTARHYVYQTALGIAFDCAEETADMCPCDKLGHPQRQRTTPTFARLIPSEAKENTGKTKEDAGNAKGKAREDTGKAKEETGTAKEDADAPAPMQAAPLMHVTAHVSVDGPMLIWIHLHVRLRVVLPEERMSPTARVCAGVLDTVVLRTGMGKLYFELQHPLPDVLEGGGICRGLVVEQAERDDRGVGGDHVEPAVRGTSARARSARGVRRGHLNGATFSTPSAETLETNAIGRGTTPPTISWYCAQPLVSSGRCKHTAGTHDAAAECVSGGHGQAQAGDVLGVCVVRMDHLPALLLPCEPRAALGRGRQRLSECPAGGRRLSVRRRGRVVKGREVFLGALDRHCRRWPGGHGWTAAAERDASLSRA